MCIMKVVRQGLEMRAVREAIRFRYVLQHVHSITVLPVMYLYQLPRAIQYANRHAMILHSTNTLTSDPGCFTASSSRVSVAIRARMSSISQRSSSTGDLASGSIFAPPASRPVLLNPVGEEWPGSPAGDRDTSGWITTGTQSRLGTEHDDVWRS